METKFGGSVVGVRVRVRVHILDKLLISGVGGTAKRSGT